jgi:hypothetical protein
MPSCRRKRTNNRKPSSTVALLVRILALRMARFINSSSISMFVLIKSPTCVEYHSLCVSDLELEDQHAIRFAFTASTCYKHAPRQQRKLVLA